MVIRPIDAGVEAGVGGGSHKATQNVSRRLVLLVGALLLSACVSVSSPQRGQLLARGQEVRMQADWAGSPPEVRLYSPQGLGWVELMLPALPQGLRLRFVGLSALEYLQLSRAGQVWLCRSGGTALMRCEGEGPPLHLQPQPDGFVVQLPATVLQPSGSWRLQWVDYWR